MQPDDPSRPKKVRSPSFPFISLREAVERAQTFFEIERRNPARPELAAGHWGYSAKSSGASQILSALRSFLLLEGEGAVRLTERAVSILQEPHGSERRMDLLRQAALAPPVHANLWERYGIDLPLDNALSSYLTVELGFNPGAVDRFLRAYKETLSYSGLRELSGAASNRERERAGHSATDSAPLPPSDLTLRFPLLNNNWGELRVLRRIAPQEKQQLEKLFEYWLDKIGEPS